MRFYLFAFIIAFFQSSILLAIFHNFLTAPNLLLVYLFINLVREEECLLKKAVLSGLFLDLFQDSLGLHISGHIFFSIVLSLLKARFEFPNIVSLFLVYAFLSILEKLWILFFFRLRYYAGIDPILLFLGLAIELTFAMLIIRRYMVYKHE